MKCSKCGQDIDGMNVQRGDETYHLTCVPREYRAEMKTQRELERGVKRDSMKTYNLSKMVERLAKKKDRLRNLSAQVTEMEKKIAELQHAGAEHLEGGE